MRTRLDTNLDDVPAGDVEIDTLLEVQRRNLADTRARANARNADETDRAHFGRAAQRLSETLRFLGEFDESLRLKEETIAVWEELGRERASFLVRLQYALVQARLGHDDARPAFEALADELTGNEQLEPYYFDFLAEYRGRMCFWQERNEEAILHLTEALEFRRAHRKQRIVDHTLTALQRVRSAGETV
jgi:tetratricopeptide (TPR) repeat protein